MSSAMVESLVLDAGKSPELVAALSLVMEADVNGEPKFTPRDCRELTKVITCRTYAKPLLELCHLVRIADACAQGASDIHIEPDENVLRVRFRVDGSLYQKLTPPFAMAPAVSSGSGSTA